MSEAYTILPIAHIRTDFPDKFGIPRQSGLVPELTARIVFEPDYRDPHALVGLEGYSHLWLIWQFSTVAAEYAAGKRWRPTVRPPRLGGNARRGVFATRSPYRPNALGLSCVELAGIEDGDLLVKGADLLDGTPIYDIKPYLPYVDAHPEARGGFADATAHYGLKVECDPAFLAKLPKEKQAALLGVLQNDPRPAYQHDPQRVYTLDFGTNKVRFTVDGQTLQVREIL
ncbi:tRNA (N6-threonylcarbamoyladenosine(37)-N6)-methyltransferase TrmO [uncultured Subdoligranulum sp.]|uniref:tRNA (N6-threonylcarbamoyladenosine(37)-N6)-methyltransferase TrmO n=1 Tax=uncultured Subdoligranulum sp. TaxID=512298 RepID=UPI0026152587|nr:tRNA (N6-threonylcarbamoyladenosine(37)-N6)-methyltransferase TrmO [uncultured Subdoligranulum sp.]